MTPAINELTARLLEVVHATRDPIISRMEALLARALRVQWKALRDEALPRLRLHAPHLRESTTDFISSRPLFYKEADDNERAIQEVVSGLRALSESISLEVYAAVLKRAIIAGANQSGTMAGNFYTTWPSSLQNWLHDHGLEKLGRDIDATTRERLRTILAKGLDEKMSYKQIARSIRDSTTFSRARAELIAITEIGNAYSQGTLAGARDIAASGETVEKSWLSQGDCCDICDGNTAQGWIDLGDSFRSGSDAPLAHPRCRCALLTRVVQVAVAA